ncbi:hypothetical protein RYX36_030123, partial [Vicia faba]
MTMLIWKKMGWIIINTNNSHRIKTSVQSAIVRDHHDGKRASEKKTIVIMVLINKKVVMMLALMLLLLGFTANVVDPPFNSTSFITQRLFNGDA